jgi:hypothetical protein
MVEEFCQDDYPALCEWYAAWGQLPPPLDLLPTFGLVAEDVAAGFLIVTDCNLALLEFFISNPKKTSVERNQALDEITDGLLEYGKSIGITNFKADTQIAKIKERAMNHGFKYIGEFSNLFLRMGD